MCLFSFHFPASSRHSTTSQVLLKLLTGLEEVKHTQKVHSAMLHSIMRKLQENQVSIVSELPEDIKFPLKSTTEVDDIEVKLKNVSTKKLVVSVRVLCLFASFFVKCRI